MLPPNILSTITGTIRVDNKGYGVKKDKWEQSIGKAKFVRKDNVGMLKVSFFGPLFRM